MSDIIGNNGRPKRNFTIERFRNNEDGTIKRRWKERIFSSEVVEVDIDEIFTEVLLEEIDLYYDDPIKIGNLEFKASEIIKQLQPDALNNTELLQLFNFDFYHVVADSGYCIFDGQTVVDSVTGICEQLEVAYKWVDVAPILREVEIDFLQENKNELLQAYKDKLLQEVKKEIGRFSKHEDPVEIEIYSEDKSVRRFLNSNGEESFRAVEKPESQVDKLNSTTMKTDELDGEFNKGDSKMIEIEDYIARRYRKRVFAELTPIDFNKILLNEIDEIYPPIKIGLLEFKASEIIKQLQPSALENEENLTGLFGSPGWYNDIIVANDGTLCWLETPTDEQGEYISFKGAYPEECGWITGKWYGHYFFKEKDCDRIMNEAKKDFLQEVKNDLLQENKDLLEKVIKDLCREKRDDEPEEIEIFCEDKRFRKFIDSNGYYWFTDLNENYIGDDIGDLLKTFGVVSETKTPEPIKPIEVRTGVILQEVTEGCSCEKYAVHEGCVANEGDTWTDFTENLKVGEMSIVKDNTGECPKCGKDIKFKEYYIVTKIEFRTK